MLLWSSGGGVQQIRPCRRRYSVGQYIVGVQTTVGCIGFAFTMGPSKRQPQSEMQKRDGMALHMRLEVAAKIG